MSDKNRVSFAWDIENFSYCWHKSGEAITSPVFYIYTPEETRWRLMLYPGKVTTMDDNVSLYLYRDRDCKGPEVIRIEYCLDILGSAGSIVDGTPTTQAFEKDMKKGYSRYIKREIVSRYVQEDILTIHCKISLLDGKAVNIRHIFARTVISIEKRVFECPIEKFSNSAPDVMHSFVFKSESKEIIMQINLDLTNDTQENIRFGILSYDECMKFCRVKIFVINSKKQKVDCGEHEYWFNSGKCTMVALELPKRVLIYNRLLYLPGDVLVLRFEFAISKGFSFDGIEKPPWEHTSYSFQNEVTEDWRKCIDHGNVSDCPCALISDLTSLHRNQGKCDMKLRTRTKTYPVHTLILKARSPVFEAMFANDMKEKIDRYLDVYDLDDETVRRFLLYLYSDQLEDLKWDDVLELYKAADKYTVISLRDKCVIYVKDNLNLDNVCQALIFSDFHHDRELKEIVQNFVLRNAKVILKSEEWKKLVETNSELALETTLRNWNE